MSGLVPYLQRILSHIPGTSMCPTALADDIFHDCAVITNCTKIGCKKLQLSLKSIRQAIELLYGLYFTWFALMRNKQSFKMLHRGEHTYRLAVVSFFMYNCLVCLNRLTVNILYDTTPLDLLDYIPLDEVLQLYKPFERTSNYKYDFYFVE